MRVGIITFHASHNYGSMLQAYALQQTVLSLGHDCRIINLRTPIQKSFYKPFFLLPGYRRKLKAFVYPKLAIADYRKHRLFEEFLQKNLKLTDEEYNSATELAAADLDFDAYISGSDQIWNTKCFDHASSYFLDFVKSGKRVAYAPSMGPRPEVEVADKFTPAIKEYLRHYSAVSVREKRTADKIRQICGIDPQVVADPTLLLSQEEWSALAGSKPVIDGDYILIYTPWYDNYKNLYVSAAKFAESRNITIISSTQEEYRIWGHNPKFKYLPATGPIEFLNLVKYSQGVFCGSFHAVVFSIIFGKPFYTYKGMDDSRISQLLKLTGLEISAESAASIDSPVFSDAYQKLNPFIESSRRFLKDSLR